MEDEVQAGTLTHREPGDKRKPAITVLHFNSISIFLNQLLYFYSMKNILWFDFRWQPRVA